MNGGWRTDKYFTECSAPCGGGTRTKQMYCDDPVPQLQLGGSKCNCDIEKQVLGTIINCNGFNGTITENCGEDKCEVGKEVAMLFTFYVHYH